MDEPGRGERREQIVTQDADVADRRDGDIVLGSFFFRTFVLGYGVTEGREKGQKKGRGTYIRTESAHGAGRLFLADSHAFVVRVDIGQNVAFLCRKA